VLQHVARDDRLLGGPQAQVPMVMHLDDLPQVSCGKCLPGTSTLTALETVSGPGYCLITSMPMDWSVAFCVEEDLLGAMRAVDCCCVRATGGGAHLNRAHRRCERLESTPGTGVDMWWVPRYKVR